MKIKLIFNGWSIGLGVVFGQSKSCFLIWGREYYWEKVVCVRAQSVLDSAVVWLRAPFNQDALGSRSFIFTCVYFDFRVRGLESNIDWGDLNLLNVRFFVWGPYLMCHQLEWVFSPFFPLTLTPPSLVLTKLPTYLTFCLKFLLRVRVSVVEKNFSLFFLFFLTLTCDLHLNPPKTILDIGVRVLTEWTSLFFDPNPRLKPNP